MSHPALEWIVSRRSIRRYRPDPVPRSTIDELLSAATWAPSAHNRQPWRFAVLTAGSTKRRLAEAMGRRLGQDLLADGLSPKLIQRDLDRSLSRITGAPVIIVVSLSMEDMDDYPDDRRRKNEWTMAVQSASMAGENLLLAAHALELGACWMCAPLFCPETVVDTLSLPSQWQPLGLITLGYPAETKEKRRDPLPTRVRYLDTSE